MSPETLQMMFTRANGEYAFARWGRPIVPVVFGVEEETLQVMKGALELVVGLSGHKMAETDPELGANLMIFFFKDWDELLGVPNLEKMVPDLDTLVARLEAQGASQYRGFRFDDAGGIQACFLFLRMQGALAEIPAETLALSQVVQLLLAWGERAFAEASPLAMAAGAAVLRPEIARLLQAAYDPLMPVAANDPSHALRLFARVQRLLQAPEAG